MAADQVLTIQTALSPDDVLVRAVQFFTTSSWRAQSQSTRSATFVGRPKVPIVLLVLAIIGLIACVVPGVVLYVLVIAKMRQLQNIVVTATPTPRGSQVVVSSPAHARTLAREFARALNPLNQLEA